MALSQGFWQRGWQGENAAKCRMVLISAYLGIGTRIDNIRRRPGCRFYSPPFLLSAAFTFCRIAFSRKPSVPAAESVSRPRMKRTGNSPTLNCEYRL
jgi:hypothetical protein